MFLHYYIIVFCICDLTRYQNNTDNNIVYHNIFWENIKPNKIRYNDRPDYLMKERHN